MRWTLLLAASQEKTCSILKSVVLKTQRKRQKDDHSCTGRVWDVVLKIQEKKQQDEHSCIGVAGIVVLKADTRVEAGG